MRFNSSLSPAAAMSRLKTWSDSASEESKLPSFSFPKQGLHPLHPQAEHPHLLQDGYVLKYHNIHHSYITHKSHNLCICHSYTLSCIILCIRLTIFYQKFLLFSPRQVKVTSDANRSRIKTRIQTGKLYEGPPSLSSDNRSRINTRSQTGNPIRTITSYPPITGSGSIPDAQQGRYPQFVNYYPLRVISTKIYSDSLLLSTATTESGVRLSCLGWHLKPISDYLSTFLHFQNAAYSVKKPTQTNNFIQS